MDIKLYILATNEYGKNLSVKTYYREQKALDKASKHISYVFRRPENNESLTDYIDSYKLFLKNEDPYYGIVYKIENLIGVN